MVWLYYNLFTHSSVDGYLNCFQFGAIMKKAAMNIHVKIFVWMYGFCFGEVKARVE